MSSVRLLTKTVSEKNMLEILNRKEIEEQTGNDWSEIVALKDGDLQSLATMLNDLRTRNIETFLYVNNHFEGSAPRTISRINELLK
jgi:uncharacterized protein YecE (DUF72 family)